MSVSRPREQAFLPGCGQKGMVSIIIPAFNREKLVLDALNSLARQVYRPIEIVVVDDGSRDATAQVAKDWGWGHPEIPVTVLTTPNKGVSSARNSGLMRAKGEYLYFLDSDDVVLPDAMSRMVEALEHNPKAPFALGRVDNTDISGHILPEDYSGLTHLRGGDLLRNHWLLFTALYRREAIRRAGGFDESLTMGEDTELNWRVVLKNGVGVRCDVVLGNRRHHDEGHLYLDSNQPERMLRSLEMHEALGNWLRANPQYRDQVILRGLIAVNNFYHRIGRGQEQHLWDRVSRLFDDLSPDTKRSNTLLKFFTRTKRHRQVFRFFYRIYRFPFNMRRRLRIFLEQRGVDLTSVRQRIRERDRGDGA